MTDTAAQTPDPAATARWWSTWAPYWEQIEDRHLGVFATAELLARIADPVLVVGAGQGLVVELLRQRGLAAEGVDLEPAMLRGARARRGLTLLAADGAALPLSAGSFRTVIVATGVVDYLDDEGLIARILDEGARVAGPTGRLLVAFYRLPPRIERVYRRIGVLAPDGRFRLRRIFDLFELLKVSPFACVRQIVRWTGFGYLGTFAYWTRLGIALPRELAAEQRIFAGILDGAAADGRDPRELHQAVPGSLPYRDATSIRRLLGRVGRRARHVEVSADCIVAECPTASDAGGGGAADAAHDGLAVATSGLTKHYPGADAPAVAGLDLAVPAGTVYGIIGPNGAGKTTTLALLGGLLRPDAGRIDLGAAIAARGARHALGYVPQEIALHERLTGRENLRFLGRIYGLGGRTLERRVAELLELVGLQGRADDPARTYSTGMKRRLNLVAGMVHEPLLMLLDEPTVGIDPQSRNCIFETIGELRAAGTTILYTTHYMEEADRLCDRVALIEHGRLLLEGPPRELVRAHGRLRVELAIRRGSAGLVAALAALPGVADVEVRGRRLTVWSTATDAASALATGIEQAAATSGAAIELRSLNEPDLEGLFLALTGKQLRDA